MWGACVQKAWAPEVAAHLTQVLLDEANDGVAQATRLGEEEMTLKVLAAVSQSLLQMAGVWDAKQVTAVGIDAGVDAG